jgi:6-phosphogluconate dehydrogenase
MNKKVSWGVLGMGVMGLNLSRNFANQGISLALYNRFVKGSEEQVALKKIKAYPELNSALPFESLDLFVAAIESPRKILIMLPAGSIIDKIIDDIIPLLDEKDILIDGGNSHYKDTGKRFLSLANKGIRFLGIGISGGKIGALKGPSLMVGGDPKAYHIVSEDLLKIAAKDINGKSCCGYLGSGGAGHYVKMVHNGVEYAEMQLIAEIFEICIPHTDSNLESIQNLFKSWQNSSSESYLLGISSEILSYKEAGEPYINRILDKASNKGTGAWATASGALAGSPNNLMAAALHARFTSSFQSLRKKNSIEYASLAINNNVPLPNLKKTYDICRWINHHQGFEMIQQARDTYKWNLSLENVALIWSEGSIIKSKLMDQLKLMFPDANSVMEMSPFKKLVSKGQKEWMNVLIYSIEKGIPTPCISSAWNYFKAITQARSSAYLIQAQRDFFGSHGFDFIDQKEEGKNHGPWA